MLESTLQLAGVMLGAIVGVRLVDDARALIVARKKKRETA